MGPGRSPEPAAGAPAPAYTEPERRALLDVARRSLEHGLERGAPLPVHPEDYAPALAAPGASFVTLRRGGALRGCVGRLCAEVGLVCDVARNAFRSGFHDARFAPLERWELRDVQIHVSVLSPSEPLPCRSEAELLAALRPREDGLIVREGARMATFLPSVWTSLPDPAAFVRALRRKAGLEADGWPASLRFERYRVVEVEEPSR